VLEEVREAGPAEPFVLRSDVVPLVHVDDRQLAIHVEDDLEPVRQRVLLELDLRDGSRRLRLGRGRSSGLRGGLRAGARRVEEQSQGQGSESLTRRFQDRLLSVDGHTPTRF
jgi:hypothetical protein